MVTLSREQLKQLRGCKTRQQEYEVLTDHQKGMLQREWDEWSKKTPICAEFMNPSNDSSIQANPSDPEFISKIEDMVKSSLLSKQR